MCDYRKLDETSVFKLGPMMYNLPVITPIPAKDIFESFDMIGKEYWVKFKDDRFNNNQILLPMGYMIKSRSPTQFYTVIKSISPMPKIHCLQNFTQILRESPVINYKYDFPVETITQNLVHKD